MRGRTEKPTEFPETLDDKTLRLFPGKTVDGLSKLVYPHGEFTKEEVKEALTLSLEMRRWVKEQLFK